MKNILPILALVGWQAATAQQAPFVNPRPAGPPASTTPLTKEQAAEEEDLQRVMGETNGAAIEIVHVLEAHLAKYPATTRRTEINRAIAKAALELHDDRRTIEYGERVLAVEPEDLQMLDRVTAALAGPMVTPQRAERALVYAKRFEQVVLRIEKEPVEKRDAAARRKDEVDRGLARSWLFQARASGLLGKTDDAIALARKSFERYASEGAAHELGRWLQAAGRNQEAAVAFAEAFAIPDSRVTEHDRAGDRKLAGENWVKAKGAGDGLGEVVLAAYDRTSALIAERNRKLKEIDPNRDVTNPAEFTVTNVSGTRLKLSDLKGSVLVMDFWATWCQPCRLQYPMYEQVKEQFKDRKDVVFLGMNADDDTTLVKPFLEQAHWNKNVYFEDGLARLLNVANLPSTIIFDKQGQISSRMNGFLPDRFVEMLTGRIRAALAESESK